MQVHKVLILSSTNYKKQDACPAVRPCMYVRMLMQWALHKGNIPQMQTSSALMSAFFFTVENTENLFGLIASVVV